MNIQKQTGFTLLETVIAIGIISTGVISIITLSMVVLNASRNSSARFQAMNFSREGIEVVRMVRDSNWLAVDSGDTSVSWNSGLSDSGDYTAIATIANRASSNVYLEFGVDAAGDTCNDINGVTYDCSAIWYDNSINTYFQTTQGTTLGDTFDVKDPKYAESDFQRVITLNPICRNDADSTDEVVITSGNCPAGYTQVGVDVLSEVFFTEDGESQSVVLEEHMYDWKY